MDEKRVITLETLAVALSEVDKKYATKEELEAVDGVDLSYATPDDIKALFSSATTANDAEDGPTGT